MPQGLLDRVTTSFPLPEVYTNWGMTELSSVAVSTSHDDPPEKKLQTSGKLLPYTMAKIIDPHSGLPLPWGARGEILVSGIGVMKGYFGDAAKTQETIRLHPDDQLPGHAGTGSDGKPRRWMHTGDEAYLDNDGYLGNSSLLHITLIVI